MKTNELKTIRVLLSIMIVPIIFYLFKLLSFIFIPLFFAIFFALLFSPILRTLTRKKIPKAMVLIIIMGSMLIVLFTVFKIGQIAIRDIINADQDFWEIAAIKINSLIIIAEDLLGMELRGNDFKTIIRNKEIVQVVQNNLGAVLKVLQNTLMRVLMSVFFLALLLSGSMNFQNVMHDTLFTNRLSSIKTFLKLERSIVTFIKVKIVINFFTGILFGLICYFFDISFPLFWGLFVFLFNFIQIVGGIIVMVLLIIFAFVEIQTTGSLVFFSIVLISSKSLLGSVLEPILMGQSFKINTIAVLVMLMLWGYLWGIPGLVLAVPITVILKTILEQFPNTQTIAKVLS